MTPTPVISKLAYPWPTTRTVMMFTMYVYRTVMMFTKHVRSRILKPFTRDLVLMTPASVILWPAYPWYNSTPISILWWCLLPVMMFTYYVHVLYCTVPYCTVPYCTVLSYATVRPYDLYPLSHTRDLVLMTHCTVLYCTVLYRTVLCNRKTVRSVPFVSYPGPRSHDPHIPDSLTYPWPHPQTPQYIHSTPL
jgi:hypothetical protein